MTEQKKRDSKFASRWRGLKNNPASLALFILVNLAALLSVLTLAFIVVYIVIRGIPNLSPELFALEYNSENVSMLPGADQHRIHGDHRPRCGAANRDRRCHLPR